MGIQGKKEGINRLKGSMMLFLVIFISISFDYFILNNALLYLLFILICIPPFILSILLKLEQDFIVKHSAKILAIIATITISLVIIANFFSPSLMFLFALVVSSNLLLIICWHFSISLYKKHRLIFIYSGSGYCIINLFLWFAHFILNIFTYSMLFYHLLVVILLPLLLALIGILLIVVAEISMKKKGLLNYI
jgi:hypothetical protein